MNQRKVELFSSREKKQKIEASEVSLYIYRSTILGTITLIPLLGITWLLGVFSVTASSTVFAWLFVFLASTQVSKLRLNRLQHYYVSVVTCREFLYFSSTLPEIQR